VSVVGYQVSIPVFEGPFDLLLHLVTRDQVDIWELPLASIVDEYVTALEQMQVLDLGMATEFLLIAAVLLELKARRLLPEPAGGEDEEEFALWEERDLLLARLLECKTFKEAAGALTRLMDRAELSLPRRAGLEDRFLGLAPDLLEGVKAVQVRDTLVRLLAPKPSPVVSTDHVAPIRASVADTLGVLVERLPGSERSTFRELTAELSERLEVIVYFLALLELYKRGMVDLEQAGKLADLHVTWLGAAGCGDSAGGEDLGGARISAQPVRGAGADEDGHYEIRSDEAGRGGRDHGGWEASRPLAGQPDPGQPIEGQPDPQRRAVGAWAGADEYEG
jgi:segregation and condensation protein A